MKSLTMWWTAKRTLWAMSLMNWAWRRLTAPKDRRETALWFIEHLKYMLDVAPANHDPGRPLSIWDRLRGRRRVLVIDKAGRVRQERVVSGNLTLVINNEDDFGILWQERP